MADYPTAGNLEDYIRSLGVLNPATATDAIYAMNLNAKVAAVKADWEGRTGWRPYVGETQTRYYDPPGPNRSGFLRGGGRVLVLDAGLLSVTNLRTGYAAQDGESSGTVLTLGTDFWLADSAGEYNAAAQGLPWECIEFPVPQVGAPRSIRIEGLWGRTTTLEDDTWQVLLKQGAYLCYQELSLQISRGLYSIRDLNSEVRYGGGGVTTLSAEVRAWANDYEQQVQLNTRVVI